MKVRMTGDITGTRDGQAWPARGGEIDLPDGEAMALCASGMAEPVTKRDAEKVEKAVAPPSEERAESGPLTTRRGPRSKE